MEAKKTLVAVALVYTLLGCQSPKNTNVPDELIGTWQTSEPKYADRFFRFTKDSLFIGTGDRHVNALAITDVKKKVTEEEQVLYTIFYVNHEGQGEKMFLIFDPATPNVLRFKNQQKIVWRKETPQ